MKYLFIFIVFLFTSAAVISADQEADGDFISALNQVRNPFIVQLPKPAVVQEQGSKRVPRVILRLKPVVSVRTKEAIVLPDLNLQGVIIGEDLHQAVINDRIVGLQGVIEGARVVSVTPNGVALIFKGRKFFLKNN